MTRHPFTEVATTPEDVREMICRAVQHGLRVHIDILDMYDPQARRCLAVQGVPSDLREHDFLFESVDATLSTTVKFRGVAILIPKPGVETIRVSVMGKEYTEADGMECMDDLLLKSETTGVPVRVECMDGTHYIGAYDGTHLIDGHGIKWKVPANPRSVCLLTMYPRTRRTRVASDVEGMMRLLFHCATHGLHATALVRRGEEFVEVSGLVTDPGKESTYVDLMLGEHRVSDLYIVKVKVYSYQPSVSREEEAMLRLLWRSEMERLPLTATRSDGVVQTGIAWEWTDKDPSWWHIAGSAFLVQEEAGLEPLRLVSVVPESSYEQRSASSCEPQLEGEHVDCRPPPVLQGGISSRVDAGAWNADECFCPTTLGQANPVCKTCNGTGFVSYETDTDDFSVLCHHCKDYRAQESADTWALEDGGVLPCEDGVTFRHQWTVVRGTERFPFETHTGHWSAPPNWAKPVFNAPGWHTWVSGWVAGQPGLVQGEQCHAMMAARVLAEFQRTDGQ